MGPNSNPLKSPRAVYLYSRTHTKQRRGHATARYFEAVRVATERDFVVPRSVGFFSIIAGRCHYNRHCRKSRCNKSCHLSNISLPMDVATQATIQGNSEIELCDTNMIREQNESSIGSYCIVLFVSCIVRYLLSLEIIVIIRYIEEARHFLKP